MHLAIEGEHPGVVRELIQLGAKMEVDEHGLSPLACAYRTGNLEMIKALEVQIKKDKGVAFRLTRKGISRMAHRFYMALMKGDLDACAAFVPQGFPIELEMPQPWPVTPLMLALHKDMPCKEVEWLLNNGAMVSTVFEGPDMPSYATALEAAIANPKYNGILPSLLHRYIKEDGDFNHLKQTPLHVATECKNYEGLKILLDELRQSSYNVKDIVNQKSFLFNNTVALHKASKRDRVDVVTLLLNHGASLEITGLDGRTALHYAAGNGSINVLKLLVHRGANTASRTFDYGDTPLLLACYKGYVEVSAFLLPFEQGKMQDAYGRNAVHLSMLRADELTQVKLFALLSPKRLDLLYQTDLYGVSAAHEIMACSKHWVLLYILREYSHSLRVRDIHWSSPWVRNLLNSDRLSIANVTRGYRVVYRYQGRAKPLEVSDSVAVGEYSLLYLAAAKGVVSSVEDLFSVGIDAETDIGKGETVLTVAAAHGQLDLVEYLVRRGAKLSHESRSSQGNMFLAAQEEKEVLQWLLVDRYIDQPKIMSDGPNVIDKDKVKLWTGVTQMQVSLKWEWRKRRAETILEYASRSQEIIKALSGTVVKPIAKDKGV